MRGIQFRDRLRRGENGKQIIWNYMIQNLVIHTRMVDRRRTPHDNTHIIHYYLVIFSYSIILYTIVLQESCWLIFLYPVPAVQYNNNNNM